MAHSSIPKCTKRIAFRLFFFIFLFWGCSHTPLHAPGAADSEVQRSASGLTETIVLSVLSDFRGSLSPQFFTQSSIERGGAPLIARLHQIARDRMGDSLIIFGGSRFLAGGLESSLDHGASTVEFFNHIGVGFTVLSKEDFLFDEIERQKTLAPQSEVPGFPILRARMSEAKFPFAASDWTKDELAPTSTIIPIRSDLSIGVIGITGMGTNRLDPKWIESESLKLRKEGAKIVLLAGKLEWDCKTKKIEMNESIPILSSEMSPAFCSKKSKLGQVISALAPGTIHAVLLGSASGDVQSFIRGIPVVGSRAKGLSVHFLYLTYSRPEERVSPQLTRIEGPIPICNQVYLSAMNCDPNVSTDASLRGPLVPMAYLGQSLSPDENSREWLSDVHSKLSLEINRVVGQLDETDTKSMNWVADAVREQVGSDFAIIPRDLIDNEQVESGPLTYEQVFRLLAQEDQITVLRLRGRELLRLLRPVYSGVIPDPAVSGLTVVTLDSSQSPPGSDLNRDGLIEDWELNRIIRTRTSDGGWILQKRLYTLAVVDRFPELHPGIGWAFGLIPKSRVFLGMGGSLREAIEKHLERKPESAGNLPLRPQEP